MSLFMIYERINSGSRVLCCKEVFPKAERILMVQIYNGGEYLKGV